MVLSKEIVVIDGCLKMVRWKALRGDFIGTSAPIGEGSWGIISL
jgi:hypothetical protein